MISIRKIINNLISFEALINARNVLLEVLNILGINDVFRLINRKKMIILLYHGLTLKNFNFYHRRYLPKSSFIKQIKYLKRKNYEFITLSDWVEIIKSKKGDQNLNVRVDNVHLIYFLHPVSRLKQQHY